MAEITEYDIQIKFKDSGAEKTAKDIDKVKDSTEKLKSTIKGLGIGFVLKRATDAIGGFINKTADYIETINLFRASMGSAADEAEKFINKAESVLGLDPKKMMDSVSAFQNLAESIGISNDRAYLMSKNMTQLAGDLSSFANIPFEDAQRKLISGLSGQVKPLREYGIALNQANLQETAYSLGIQQRVKDMTQAQKTELIYYQIMTSTTKMQGDLGRSLLSPANALRVMKNEFQKLARAVGSIFIPIMMKLIPVIRAVTQLLTEAAQAIARFFGFNISNYNADLSSVGNMLSGVSDDIGDVGDAAEETAGKLNKMLMPFDELNNITSSTGTGSTGGLGSVGGGGSLGIDLPEYDMFESATNGMVEKVEKIKNVITTLLPIIKTIAAAFAAWKVGSNVINALDKIFDLTTNQKKSSMEILMGITLIITGLTTYIGSAKKMLQGDLSIQNLLIGIFGAGTTGGGVALVAKGLGLATAGPIGLAVTLLLTLLLIGGYALKKDDEFYKKVAEEKGWDWDGLSFKDKVKMHIDVPLEILGLKDIDDSKWKETVNNANVFDKINAPFKVILEKVGNGIKTFFNELPEKMGKWFASAVLDSFNFIKWSNQDIHDKISSAFSKIWDLLVEYFDWEKQTTYTDTILTKVKEFMGEIVKNIIDGFLNGMNEDWNRLCEGSNRLFDLFTKGVKDKLGIHSPSTVFEEIGQNLIKGLTGGIEGMWSTLTDKFDNIKGLTNFEWSLPKLKIPHMYWSSKPATGWIANLLSKLNLPTSLPKLNIEWYAQGGFPDVGQLFVANEAGPELVGNIGNRTAVANKDQITTAIANATYQAMSRALAENNQNDGQPFIINVGNEQLYKGYANYKNQQSNKYGINI